MTKYGEEMTQEICNHLKAGLNRTDACILVGIHYETFTEWMKKAEFAEAIKKAETSVKARNIAIIQRAGEKSWQASAWWLERKHKDEFAIPKNPEIAIDKGVVVIKWAKDENEVKKLEQ